MMSPLPDLAGNIEVLLKGYLTQANRLAELHCSAYSGIPDSR